jgi:hypothetical protein
MAIDRLRTVLVPSVGKRIASGFAVVLTLLVVLVAVTFRLIVPIDAGAARVRADSAEAEAAAVVALQVGDAHARVVRYALSGTMADQKAATDSLGTLDEAIATATATHLGDASGLVARVARYRVSVDETFGPVTRRLAAIERIHTAGTEIRTPRPTPISCEAACGWRKASRKPMPPPPGFSPPATRRISISPPAHCPTCRRSVTISCGAAVTTAVFADSRLL